MNGIGLKQLLRLPQENRGKKKKLPMPLVWSIIGAIVFLAISGFSGGGTKPTRTEDEVRGDGFVLEEYALDLEKRLVSALQTIQGSGKVAVFLNFEDKGEKIPAADIRAESQEAEEESKQETHHEREETIIFSEKDSGQSPYIVEEKLPQPSGVLVIAEGAREERVRLEIYEAVKAVFGLPAHRIKVSY